VEAVNGHFIRCARQFARILIRGHRKNARRIGANVPKSTQIEIWLCADSLSNSLPYLSPSARFFWHIHCLLKGVEEVRRFMKLPHVDLSLLILVGCGIFVLFWIISSLQ
jgi:hypothetical protein